MLELAGLLALGAIVFAQSGDPSRGSVLKAVEI